MIDKKDLVLVSFESMNTTHFEEIEIINTLSQLLNTHAEYETVLAAFDTLLEHMEKHFSSEEKLMKENHFPSLNMHKADHDKVLNQARYAHMMWRNTKDIDDLSEYINEEFIIWLDQHIKAMDTPLADFLLQ